MTSRDCRRPRATKSSAARSPERAYLADDALTLACWLALTRIERPLLVEGPAGVGKTDTRTGARRGTLARAPAHLQCYEGLDEARALYEWDYAKQILFTQLLRETAAIQTAGAKSLAEAADRLVGAGVQEAFFSERFSASAARSSALTNEKPVVMLIDEVDRSDAQFLRRSCSEVLAERQVTIPEIGTIRASSPTPLHPDEQRLA